MKELTDEQKECLRKLMTENESKTTEISGEELNGVSGGIYHFASDRAKVRKTPVVKGPQTCIEQCQFCGAPIPGPDMRDHIMNTHMDELAEFIKDSGIA